MKKTNKRKSFGPMSFVRSDKVKAKRDTNYLFETFTHEYIEPCLRGKNKRKKFKYLKSCVSYLFGTYDMVRYEEQVRMIKVVCDACRKNVDTKIHGKRYIHSDGYGICKAWKIRSFMVNKMNVETRKLVNIMTKGNIQGHSLRGLTGSSKKGRII